MADDDSSGAVPYCCDLQAGTCQNGASFVWKQDSPRRTLKVAGAMVTFVLRIDLLSLTSFLEGAKV